MKSNSLILRFNLSLPLAMAMAALVAMPSAEATDLYWDRNGDTAGFSTVAGSWNDTNNYWNTDSTGGAGTLSAVTTSADDLFIPQATTNTGSITLTGATKNASSITFLAHVGPTTTLTGGTINIGGTGAFSGIRQQSTGNNTISSGLVLNSGNTAFSFSNSSTGLLTISGAVTGTATAGNVTQNLAIGSSSSGGITISGAIADVSGSATTVALTVNNTSTGSTTLSGANTYTGGTTISAGTLSVGSGLTGSIVGDVANSGTLRFNRSDALTYGGVISGTGAVTKAGAGTLTITGANSYDGTTTISAGSLNVQHATGLGSTTGGTSVSNNAALQLQGGIIVGAEALTLNGTGDSGTGALLNVSGDNTFGGAITRGAATTIGSTAGTLTLSGTIGGAGGTTFTGAGNIISSGVISSTATSAGITKTGSGTLTLSAANTFTGTTTVSDGIVALTNPLAMQFSAYDTAGSNGTTIGLDVSDPGALTSGSLKLGGLVGSTALTGAFTAGYGSVTNLTLESGRNHTYSGVIADGASGMTLTRSGAGSQTLSGDNTYTGDTYVNQGSLTITHNNALGTTAGKTVVNTDGGRLSLDNASGLTVAEPISFSGNVNEIAHDLESATGANTISGPVTLSASSGRAFARIRVAAASPSLTFTGGITSTSDSQFVMNPLAGTTLAITTTPIDLTSTGIFWHDSGTGVSALGVTGNTFGLTSLSTGTIRLDVANALPSITRVNIGHNFANGGTLDLNGNSQKIFGLYHTVPQNGVLSALVVTSATAATLTLDSSTIGGDPAHTNTTPYTYGGNITGALSIVKEGPNTATFAGANTYTGGTTINGGTLALGSSGALGTSGTIAFGGGTLQHSASNTTDYSARFSTAASQQYSIDTNSQSVTLATALTSSGGTFTKSGLGTLTLTGTNTYTGTTTINGGGLAVSNGAAIADTGAVTLADVSGATLTVQNSETIGSLRGGGATGGNVSIASAQTLTVAETGSQTFAGIISDAGGLTKTGAGTLTLTGTNTYTGDTTVTAGQLVVNGSSSGSAHTVGSGGTLGGTGTVGALVVQNGGTIAPGNSPGILNVVGDTTWENGGNYNWELLNATGVAGTGWDQLAITGALDLSNLTAGGFNVNVWSLSTFAGTTGNAQNFDGIGGIYSWPIATATGGITGFDAGDFTIFTTANNGTNGFTNDFTGGTFSMSQTGNNLYLNYLGPTPVPEPGSAFTVLALFSGAVLNRRKRVVKH